MTESSLLLPALVTARRQALRIAHAAMKAVQASTLLDRQLRMQPDSIRLGKHLFPLAPDSRVIVIGAGKAVAHMAKALEQRMGPRIHRGCVIVKTGHALPLEYIQCFEASHPLPDAQGLAATQQLLQLLTDLQPQDLVICLLTGGASALLVDTPPGITLDDLQLTSSLLLRAGADIQALNAVRKHLSRIKGGGLLTQVQPARLLTLAISDVVGDSLEVIASGPTVADASTYADAMDALQHFRVWDETPNSVRNWLSQGRAGVQPETLKVAPEAYSSHATVLLGSNHLALEAAAEVATQERLEPHILRTDATRAADVEARDFVAALRLAPPNSCLLLGGEMPVRVQGTGLGGRCQHFALTCLTELTPDDRLHILTVGTDGTDGPTEAAGAAADPHLADLARAAGLDAAAALAQFDSYHFYQQLRQGHFMTGPTGTNVMDVVIGIRY